MRQSAIALFDFDHTITTQDSLVPFLIYTQGRFKTFYTFALLLPYFIGFLLGFVSRQYVKEKILQSFFKGVPLSTLQKQGRDYAFHDLDSILKPEAIKRLKWHQEQGHRCILVSASVDVYLIPWAEKYHFNDVITSILDTDAKGKITGKLKGKNCWGPEKARRLLELLGSRKNHILYVYGDSQGDAELLKMADYPFFRRFQ